MKLLTIKYWFCWVIIFMSCTTGNLEVIDDLPNSLKEISAAEIIAGQEILWMIEDQGNASNLYGYDFNNRSFKTIVIHNAKNVDWEDLASDKEGNLYIGDFGNNNGKRKEFSIYKLDSLSINLDYINAEQITFSVPKHLENDDFESFFLFKNHFYIFSKNDKKGTFIKVPNSLNSQKATIVSKFNLKGKNDAITSADISNDGKKVVLLNHNKLWLLSNFEGDDFFSGDISRLKFNHTSQKEGICFLEDNSVVITDEREGATGGNIYSFNLDN